MGIWFVASSFEWLGKWHIQCFNGNEHSWKIFNFPNLMADGSISFFSTNFLLRETTNHWKMKKINSTEQRIGGFCPLTPKEVGIFLQALGYAPSTLIYIAAGEIYGGNTHLSELTSLFPNLVFKVCWFISCYLHWQFFISILCESIGKLVWCCYGAILPNVNWLSY